MNKLDDLYFIDRLVLSLFVKPEYIRLLEERGIVPCTLGELKEASGDLVSSILGCLDSCVLIEDKEDSIDYLGKGNGDKEDEYLRIFETFKIRFLENETQSTTVSGFNRSVTEYSTDGDPYVRRTFHRVTGKLLSEILYQFIDGKPCGSVKHFYTDDVPHVGYFSIVDGVEQLQLEQRIFKSAWSREFPLPRHDITPEEVSRKLGWSDYRNLETMRCMQTFDADTRIYTLHRSQIDRKECIGSVLKQWTVTKDKIVTVTNCRYIPPVEMVRSGNVRIEKPRRLPSTICYKYADDGALDGILWGNGNRLEYVIEEDIDGNVIRISSCATGRNDEPQYSLLFARRA